MCDLLSAFSQSLGGVLVAVTVMDASATDMLNTSEYPTACGLGSWGSSVCPLGPGLSRQHNEVFSTSRARVRPFARALMRAIHGTIIRQHHDLCTLCRPSQQPSSLQDRVLVVLRSPSMLLLTVLPIPTTDLGNPDLK